MAVHCIRRRLHQLPGRALHYVSGTWLHQLHRRHILCSRRPLHPLPPQDSLPTWRLVQYLQQRQRGPLPTAIYRSQRRLQGMLHPHHPIDSSHAGAANRAWREVQDCVDICRWTGTPDCGVSGHLRHKCTHTSMASCHAVHGKILGLLTRIPYPEHIKNRIMPRGVRP